MIRELRGVRGEADAIARYLNVGGECDWRAHSSYMGCAVERGECRMSARKTLAVYRCVLPGGSTGVATTLDGIRGVVRASRDPDADRGAEDLDENHQGFRR